MGLGESIVNAIEARRERVRKRLPGAHGEFFRSGGNALLYEVPVTTGSIVIDAGGYMGEWTSKMIARYGCRSEIYEPFPLCAEKLKYLFRSNSMVNVHAAALGGSARTTRFTFFADGTSEFGSSASGQVVEAPVEDIASAIHALGQGYVACLKLNIEGGEYEVLERLINNNQIDRVGCILIQFHPQPEGWESRLQNIVEKLKVTHVREWCYPMVWEKWVRRSNA